MDRRVLKFDGGIDGRQKLGAGRVDFRFCCRAICEQIGMMK